MAHLDNNSAIFVFLVLKVGVVVLEVIKSLSSLLEIPSVRFDLLHVVINIASVLVDIGGVLVTECLGILNSVLEVRGGESEGFCGNKHVGGLRNLELVVLCSEKSISKIGSEIIDLSCEIWKRQIS